MNQELARSFYPLVLENCIPEPMSGCLLWEGAVNNSGYGQKMSKSVHRISYAANKSDIPKGACVLHKCDTRRCINPEHLFLGTMSDNSRDMVAKGKHKCPARLRTCCPRGHPYDNTNTNGARICKRCCVQATINCNRRKKNVR